MQYHPLHIHKFFFLYFFFYESAASTATQILVSPQNQTVPMNSVARFTCRTTTSFVVWQVNNAQLSTEMWIEAFQLRGIRVDSENGSVLLVNATWRNNGIKIRCLTGLELNAASETAILTVFGELRISDLLHQTSSQDLLKFFRIFHVISFSKQIAQLLPLTSLFYHWGHLLYHGFLHMPHLG